MSDMDQSDVVPAPAADAAPAEPAPAPAPDPVPVTVQEPSSASDTQQEEKAEDKREPMSLEDATRVLVDLVRAHRTAGDAVVEAVLADVEAALPAKDEESEAPAEA